MTNNMLFFCIRFVYFVAFICNWSMLCVPDSSSEASNLPIYTVTVVSCTLIGAFVGHMITKNTNNTTQKSPKDTQDKSDVDIRRYKKQRRRTILLCSTIGLSIGMNLVLIHYIFYNMKAEVEQKVRSLQEELQRKKDRILTLESDKQPREQNQGQAPQTTHTNRYHQGGYANDLRDTHEELLRDVLLH